jgi:uncharacterized protein YndB with AHSA1/START domain
VAKKSSKKKTTKTSGKAPSKPKASTPAKKPAPQPATKASSKPAAKGEKETSRKDATKIAGVKPATRKAAASSVEGKPGKKPAPIAPAPVASETPGRPALKVHVHAGASTQDAPRGRSRKESSVPTHSGVGDAAVRKATGKGWVDWFEILDEAGAKAMDHKAIVAILSEKHAATDWWAQTLTVGYEQARGLRQKNEKPDGFEAGVSKTINAATAKLYKAWEDGTTRERWMGEHKVEVRVANADKNIRMTWLVQGPDEGSSVEVYFWPKDANKCLVQVQQRKLADADAVQRVRAFWSVKLENLRAMMEKA